MPRRAKMRHRAAVSRLLPADELVPWIMRVLATTIAPRQVMLVVEKGDYGALEIEMELRY